MNCCFTCCGFKTRNQGNNVAERENQEQIENQLEEEIKGQLEGRNFSRVTKTQKTEKTGFNLEDLQAIKHLSNLKFTPRKHLTSSSEIAINQPQNSGIDQQPPLWIKEVLKPAQLEEQLKSKKIKLCLELKKEEISTEKRQNIEVILSLIEEFRNEYRSDYKRSSPRGDGEFLRLFEQIMIKIDSLDDDQQNKMI